MAVSITPKGGKTVLGVVEMKGNTNIDNVAKLVDISNPQVTGTYFPSLDNATKEKMDQLFKTFVPSTFSISLHSLIASTPKKEAPAGVQLNNDPPKDFCRLPAIDFAEREWRARSFGSSEHEFEVRR